MTGSQDSSVAKDGLERSTPAATYDVTATNDGSVFWLRGALYGTAPTFGAEWW